jgi:hypothetical protein
MCKSGADCDDECNRRLLINESSKRRGVSGARGAAACRQRQPGFLLAQEVSSESAVIAVRRHYVLSREIKQMLYWLSHLSW